MVVLVLLFHFLLVLSAAAVGLAPAPTDQDGCQPKRCKHGGPPVRYPFRLKGRQPDHCGAAGFNLSCNNKSQTVLELPTAVKLLVKRIDYVKQRIQVHDEHGCIQKQLPNLKISASPFMFISITRSEFGGQLGNFTLFNCSVEDQADYYDYNRFLIPCLSGPGFSVKYADSESPSPDLFNCSRTVDIIAVPNEIISPEMKNNFHFYWSKPACGSCEEQHQGCRPNNTNTLGIDCYDIHWEDKGTIKSSSICRFRYCPEI